MTIAGAVTPTLPHTGVARMLTAVRRCDATSIAAVGVVPAAHPLVTAQAAPVFVVIEMAAQATAAMRALERSAGDAATPVSGHLVRVRDAAFAVSEVAVDTDLDVTATVVATAAPLSVYRVAVERAGVTIATATISVVERAPACS